MHIASKVLSDGQSSRIYKKLVYEDQLVNTVAWKQAVEDIAEFRGLFPEMNELQTIHAMLLMMDRSDGCSHDGDDNK